MDIEKIFLSALFFLNLTQVKAFISQFSQNGQRLQYSTRHQSSSYNQETIVDLKEFEIYKTNHPLSPPLDLLDLEIGEKVNPYENITITKLASNPHIYLLKNFIGSSLREKLIEEATDKGMEYSGTKAGEVKQRVNSYTAWVKPHSNKSEDDNEDEKCNENIHGAEQIATVMTKMSSWIFLPDFFREHMANGEKLFHEENLQIVKYDVDGKFDVHHDGLSRFLTVLTYLNGVAGTWFPYAIVEKKGAVDNDDEDEPPNMHAGNVAAEKEVGKDGIVILGNDDDRFEESRNVVKVEAGDAIAFYNYDWLVNFNNDPNIPSTGPIMNWRSIHSGLKTEKKEKWIATNWFQFNE